MLRAYGNTPLRLIKKGTAAPCPCIRAYELSRFRSMDLFFASSHRSLYESGSKKVSPCASRERMSSSLYSEYISLKPFKYSSFMGYNLLLSLFPLLPTSPAYYQKNRNKEGYINHGHYYRFQDQGAAGAFGRSDHIVQHREYGNKQ